MKLLVVFVALIFTASFSYAHENGLWGEAPVKWKTKQISKTVATRLYYGTDVGGLATIEGVKYLNGGGFSFDVKDKYAFDIDESVDVEVEFYLHDEPLKVEAKYKKRGDVEEALYITLPAYRDGSRLYKHVFTFEDARFANLSTFQTDFSVGLSYASADIYKNKDLAHKTLTISNITIKRSYETPEFGAYGKVEIKVIDETGRLVPVRMGIYDESGRLPLPSKDAVAVKKGHHVARVVDLNPGLFPWPVSNRTAFYIDGKYRAKLPVGQYELVITKGPEYRTIHRRFHVDKGEKELIEIELDRWVNMPSQGWYSGDNHIHYIRNNKSEDANLLLFTQAEDLHVANILSMGNIAGIPWDQYAWEPVIQKDNEIYSLVPGQEDPRTSRLGHTVSLNISGPIRNDPDRYMLYRRIFEETYVDGGVTGYAHVVGSRNAAPKGAALHVPLHLVDLFEILQRGGLGTERWFDFLNLGYKLAPSAGTDYMLNMMTLPGAERNYVYIDGEYTLQKWFDALQAGKTFVTNGPILEFKVNGMPMGSELHLKSGDKIEIKASAAMNPDIDQLRSLELIQQGEVIKSVISNGDQSNRLVLNYETTLVHGSWFVVRAGGTQPRTFRVGRYGKGPAKSSISAPIYIYVDGQSFWKPDAVPGIVEQLKSDMEFILQPPGKFIPPQAWETNDLTLETWAAQKAILQKRIYEASVIYDDMVKRAMEKNN